MSEQAESAVARFQRIASGVDVAFVSAVSHQRAIADESVVVRYRFHLIIYRVDVVVSVDIKILGLSCGVHRREEIIIDQSHSHKNATDGRIKVFVFGLFIHITFLKTAAKLPLIIVRTKYILYFCLKHQ